MISQEQKNIIENSHKENFCFAPFNQILLQPTGKVAPCCYHFGYNLGQYPNSSIEQIWNGSKIQKLREEFLTGNIRICKSRMHNIQCQKNFSHFKSSTKLLKIQNEMPKRLDLRLNGQCNLSCIMCDVWQQPNQIFDKGEFWKESEEKIFPFLKEIDVLGGEPFVQKDTFKLIKIITDINPECSWGFVSNGNYIFNKKIKDIVENLNIRFLQISLDSLDVETFSLIRKGGDLDLVLKTIDEIYEINLNREKKHKGFLFKISMCVIQQNWREIPRFLEFCKEKKATPELQYAFYDPSKNSSLSFLNRIEKDEILEFLNKSILGEDSGVIFPIIQPLQNISNASN